MSKCLHCGEDNAEVGGGTEHTCSVCMERIRKKVRDYSDLHKLIRQTEIEKLQKEFGNDEIDSRFDILDL